MSFFFFFTRVGVWFKKYIYEYRKMFYKKQQTFKLPLSMSTVNALNSINNVLFLSLLQRAPSFPALSLIDDQF